jgi:putative ubiquitin-RnfH superfamily antitoxin RatB of RatAB toxin-antitoxin module
MDRITIRVEVAYARPDKQRIISVSLEEGSTLEAAVIKSGMLEAFPEIDLESEATGIFSLLRPRDHVLKDGDRVEIYRSLLTDPRDARRERSRART